MSELNYDPITIKVGYDKENEQFLLDGEEAGKEYGVLVIRLVEKYTGLKVRRDINRGQLNLDIDRKNFPVDKGCTSTLIGIIELENNIRRTDKSLEEIRESVSELSGRLKSI